MDKLYLDFDEHGLLTMHIEGDLEKFKSTLKYENNKYFFGVEKRLIENRNLVNKLTREHISLIPKVDTINSKKKIKVESTDEEKYEVQGLPDDITFDGKNFYSLVPLEWTCNNGKYFTCLNTSYTRSTVMKMLEKQHFDTSLINDYLNEKILPKILNIHNVDRTATYDAEFEIWNTAFDLDVNKISLPNHLRKINIKYENGKIILEKPKTLIKINIPSEVSTIGINAKNYLYTDTELEKGFLYDIYIPESVKIIDSCILDIKNGKINSLVFAKEFVENGICFDSINASNSVNNLQIPCDIKLLEKIINIKYAGFKCIYDKNSHLTIYYKNEEELLSFIKSFCELDRKLDTKRAKIRDFQTGEFIGDVARFKFNNETWKYLLFNFTKDASLKDIDITLCGPELSKKVQNKIKKMIKNDKVHFSIDELENKELEKSSEKQEVNKTTLIADDIIEEIKSIDYFGINKEKVKNKLKAIIDKYNEDLANLNGGLSLQSEEGLYTELLIKLNELKDNLYQKFEKNMDVHDMLDEVNILLRILNGEEVVINSSLESDFYSLSKNILPFVDEKITDDLRNYLESEKQKLENYLLTGENKPYEDMDKFILSIRTHLNIVLLSIRNYLNKEEILEVIRDYTNMQMQINYEEPIKNYLSILLQEIDKTKNEILNLDENANVDEILNMLKMGFENLDSYEIVKYVNDVFNRLYKLYLEVKYQDNLVLKRESYKIKL